MILGQWYLNSGKDGSIGLRVCLYNRYLVHWWVIPYDIGRPIIQIEMSYRTRSDTSFSGSIYLPHLDKIAAAVCNGEIVLIKRSGRNRIRCPTATCRRWEKQLFRNSAGIIKAEGRHISDRRCRSGPCGGEEILGIIALCKRECHLVRPVWWTVGITCAVVNISTQ